MLTFADLSEFQKAFGADAYIKGGYRVIIVRAHNGYRQDNQWPARRDYVRAKPFAAVGYYQYIAKDRDAASQARDFTASIGRLAPNEFPIGDLEEGAGDQTARADAWFRVVDQWAGFKASLYTGKSFLQTNLGGTARWGSRPLWLASYLGSYQADMTQYPPGAEFWQYTDRARFPGLVGGVDGSVFPGSLEQFLPTVRPGRPAPGPKPKPTQSRGVGRQRGWADRDFRGARGRERGPSVADGGEQRMERVAVARPAVTGRSDDPR